MTTSTTSDNEGTPVGTDPAPSTPPPPTSGSTASAPKVSNWTIHAKNTRSALLAWSKALEKVDQRASDVAEVVRAAGDALPDDDVIAIAHEIAGRTGRPVQDVAAVAGVKLGD